MCNFPSVRYSMFSPAESQISLLMLLLVAFIVKHFLADYLWQTEYMLRKTAQTGWQLPLLSHAGFHGLLTSLILLPPCGLQVSVLLGMLDFCIHFVVDYWKAQKYKAVFASKAFWIGLGFDQMLHHLTYPALAYIATHFACAA